MAVGLAVLTAYGSTTIDRLSAEIYATPTPISPYIPEDLRDRPLEGPAGRRGPRNVGLARGRVDHGRAVRGCGDRDAGRGAAGTRARRRCRTPPIARAYAGRRWRCRPRPHPLTRDRPRRTGRPPPRADIHQRARVGSASRRWSMVRSASSRATRHSRPCQASSRQPDAVRLGRPGRTVAGAGRGGRVGPGPPSADRRGRPRRQPARQDRDDRRRHPHRPVRAGPHRLDRDQRDRPRPGSRLPDDGA